LRFTLLISLWLCWWIAPVWELLTATLDRLFTSRQTRAGVSGLRLTCMLLLAAALYAESDKSSVTLGLLDDQQRWLHTLDFDLHAHSVLLAAAALRMLGAAHSYGGVLRVWCYVVYVILHTSVHCGCLERVWMC
jgi:hypothetical protein